MYEAVRVWRLSWLTVKASAGRTAEAMKPAAPMSENATEWRARLFALSLASFHTGIVYKRRHVRIIVVGGPRGRECRDIGAGVRRNCHELGFKIFELHFDD
jgi:hypothetical protein